MARVDFLGHEIVARALPEDPGLDASTVDAPCYARRRSMQVYSTSFAATA
jgi:hypothetical protein